jgi:hypothetical protein
MFMTCWSVKGGAGVSVVSAALGALMAGRHSTVLLVDLGGDLPAVLGLPDPDRPGVLDWCCSEATPEALERLVVEVAPGLQLLGRGDGPPAVEQLRASELAEHLSSFASVVVVDAGSPLDGAPPDAVAVPGRPTRRALGEHLRQVGSSIFVTRACYLVVLAEPGRSLDSRDVATVLGLPLLGVVEADPAVARAIDAGTLVRRVPASLRRGLRHAG